MQDPSTELCPMKTEEDMYVFMCVCVCVCVRACVRACVRMYACMHACMHACMYVPICMYTFVVPVQRQGLVMSLAVAIQGQKAYGDTASAGDAFQLFTTL